MLFALDIGNSNIVAGIYDGDDLLTTFRLKTDKDMPSKHYARLFSDSLQKDGIKEISITSSVISCVVPSLDCVMREALTGRFKVEPLIIDHDTDTGMPNLYNNPKEVGADRIVNSVAAFNRFKTSLIVVDFGTATTFDCISEKGEYLGGAITPGITISSEALFDKASKLPRVDLTRPENLIGKSTVESIQSGIIYGYASLVDGMIDKISLELKPKPKVIATGGLADLIANESTRIDYVDEILTLKGLKYINEING